MAIERGNEVGLAALVASRLALAVDLYLDVHAVRSPGNIGRDQAQGVEPVDEPRRIKMQQRPVIDGVSARSDGGERSGSVMGDLQRPAVEIAIDNVANEI